MLWLGFAIITNTPAGIITDIMLIRRSFLVCLTLLALCGWVRHDAQAQTAALTAQATSFVDTLGKDAVAVMADRQLSRSQRVDKFRSLLHAGFDLPTVARFVLGRYWNTTTPAQQQEYMTQFEEMVVRSYAERFDSYSGETFKIVSSRPEGDHDAFVVTAIDRPNGPPINVEWRVRQRDNRLGIIDVVVEGVSMSVTQRQEFSSVIQAKAGNMDAFLQALKDKNASMAAAVQ